MIRRAGALGCAVASGIAAALLASAAPARAGQCGISQPFLYKAELESPTWTGGSSGFNEPFAVIAQTNLSIIDQLCTPDCPASSFIGDQQCGDLATTPVEANQLLGSLQQLEYNGYEARLLADGKWEHRADVFIEAPPDGFGRTAYSNVFFGHREVFEVTSSGVDPQPLRIRIRESGVVPKNPIIECPGLFRKPPFLRRYLRVRQSAPGQTGLLLPGYPVDRPPDRTTTLEGPSLTDQRIEEWDFELDVAANGVLYVDLYYTSAPGGTVPIGVFPFPLACDSLSTQWQWIEPNGGLALQISGAPGVSLVPRSGLVYAPAPEPGALASGAAALGALAARRRRCLRARRSR